MWQVGSTCYASPLAANQAAASSQVGAVVSHGSASHVVGVQAVSDTAITYSFNPIDSGPPVLATVSVSPQPCGLLTHVEALELSWKVAAVWIAAWSIVFVAKAAWRVLEGGGNDA